MEIAHTAKAGEQPAKVGTIPMQIVVRASKAPLLVGSKVTFRRATDRARWERGIISAINQNGYLFIDRN